MKKRLWSSIECKQPLPLSPSKANEMEAIDVDGNGLSILTSKLFVVKSEERCATLDSCELFTS